MLYNGIIRCHGNMYVTFIDVCFCNVHIIGPIYVRANFEINRYSDEFITYAASGPFYWMRMSNEI